MTIYQVRYPSRPQTVGIVRREIEAAAREHGFTGERLEDLRTVVSEAVTNAVRHGRGANDGHVIVRLETRDDELVVTVRDEGPGMLPRRESSGLGLGLPIISMLTDRMEIISGAGRPGTELHLYFAL